MGPTAAGAPEARPATSDTDRDQSHDKDPRRYGEPVTHDDPYATEDQDDGNGQSDADARISFRLGQRGETSDFRSTHPRYSDPYGTILLDPGY